MTTLTHDTEAPIARNERAGVDDREAARRVLRLEAEGIEALSEALDETFVAAVAALAEVSGRIVVSGMGKAGHIARKIAATLASTGSPAMFVHPGEASHGDLGMIAHQDGVLALSNSGETSELTDLVAYTRRFSIPLIAIVGKAGSTLAKAADTALVLPDTKEACPMGLAPTTSTTLMLALGDAIAVALLERKGFDADDYRVFHPGGKLGQRLLRVADLMHQGEEIPTVEGSVGMREALLRMTGRPFGVIGVLDGDGYLIGVITDGDLRRHMDNQLLTRTAAEVMTADPYSISPDALAAEALAFMNAHRITSLFVVAERRPDGILHVHDLLRAGVV